jgi:hypothetical protein
LWIKNPDGVDTLRIKWVWRFPDDFDHGQATMLAREGCRPCGPATIKYFIALARNKKIPDVDVNNAEKYLMTYIRDLSEYCELAVMAALNDIRMEDDNPFFPTVSQIRKIARVYHEGIINVQKYLERE